MAMCPPDSSGKAEVGLEEGNEQIKSMAGFVTSRFLSKAEVGLEEGAERVKSMAGFASSLGSSGLAKDVAEADS